ncbi:uncharacterized protein [Parasteatoda tepidariorum]|uniref:uncharacterized protein n=1 Tax=Parasteatoda tepidariorum TaxID=114398 RepID=UPI001C728243|nr:uncharacterized protein LOC107457419 [Parasteatoda tepidariorum]
MEMQVLKYLGIDPGLTWIAHLNHVKERVGKFNNLIKRVARATWGLKPKILKIIYQKATERIILYAASVWYRNTTRIDDKINAIQRTSLIVITRAYSTTITEALQILAGVKPNHLRIIEDTCIKRLRWNYRIEEYDRNIQEILRARILEKPVINIHPSLYTSVPFGGLTPTNKGIEIFTDGSRMEVADAMNNTSEHRTGMGMIIRRDGKLIRETSIRLSNNCSVYRAEMMAINTALQWFANNQYPNATIYSDSLSSLQALKNPKPDSELAENTKQIWKNNILLGWVKAHIGIEGNKEADRVAKNAISLGNVDIEVPSSTAQVKTLVKGYNFMR